MRNVDTVLGMKALAQCIQRARADVAIHHPQRAEREGEKVASRISGRGGLHAARSVHEERRLKVARAGSEGRRQKAEGRRQKAEVGAGARLSREVEPGRRRQKGGRTAYAGAILLSAFCLLPSSLYL